MLHLVVLCTGLDLVVVVVLGILAEAQRADATLAILADVEGLDLMPEDNPLWHLRKGRFVVISLQ
jgi:hypothetical protein